MIVLITPAERKGGILQFSFTMLKTMIDLDENVILLAPDSIEKQANEEIESHIVRYTKIKSINPNNNEIQGLTRKILSYSPELVIGLEDSMLVQQLIWGISKKNIKAFVVIHDVIAHPYFKMSKREMVVEFLRRYYMKKTIKNITKIIVLSQNSLNEFVRRYPSTSEKIYRLTLGAHVPDCKSLMPPELMGVEDYYLFFGRIDKYKGVERLVNAYNSQSFQNKLVIAGKGNVLEDTKSIIDNNPNIILVNRFIDDEEMVYLYQKAMCIVLPYIEASQSGVLPIAYHYGKPVIVSDLPGLTENVVDHKTGLIFSKEEDLGHKLNDIIGLSLDDVTQYYEERFNWEKNIATLLCDVRD